MKHISLCADDFAITPPVSKAILSLADKGAIQATSCMVTTPHWQADAQLLTHYFDHIDIGLHLNLTEGSGLTSPYTTRFPSLASILLVSHLRCLNGSMLLEEIHAQICCFMNTTGKTPDFIDGHQHIHHLPQVRKALLAAIKKVSLPPSIWIRSTSPLIHPASNLKNYIIEASGAKTLRTELEKETYNTNAAFAGAYSLSTKETFRPLMRSWLRDLPNGGLIMCHPGLADKNDSLSTIPAHSEAREIEFNYLGSTDFTDDCQHENIQLCKPSSLFA